jgi:hypothetical protein
MAVLLATGCGAGSKSDEEAAEEPAGDDNDVVTADTNAASQTPVYSVM